MNIVVYGAGMIGLRTIQEALNRGHKVTVIVRNPSRITLTHPNLTVKEGDMLNADDVARSVAGHDVVVNATRQPAGQPGQSFSDAARALIEGMTRSGVRRLLVVGGAGSLEVAPGVQLVDTPEFPPAWKPGALAMRDALDVYRASSLDWTYFSPAAMIAPGQRTGHYRTGTNQLVTDEKGESRISAEDYAVALLNELEKPRFVRQRFTVAY
jgi:putative NADH-flavin reductase